MTTKKFAKYLEKQCKEIINFSLEPLFGEYVVLVSGKRVGVIYQEKLYVLYAPTFENVNMNGVFQSIVDTWLPVIGVVAAVIIVIIVVSVIRKKKKH